MLRQSFPFTFRLLAVIALVSVWHIPAHAQNDEDNKTIYSGPQTGEKLPGFVMKGAFGESEGKEINLVKTADGNPIVVIFVHERSRPAFGLANVIMKYCLEHKDDVTRGICFLSADPTETQTWLGRIKNYFPKGTPVGISHDGVEGPGAYGLNRNVALTILVGKENKTTASFALVQPSLQADGPKVLAEIAKAIGTDQKPDIAKYIPRTRRSAFPQTNPKLLQWIRQLTAQDTPKEKIDQSIEKIEALIKDKRNLQTQLGALAQRQLQSGRMKAIENKTVKSQIEQWARQYGQTARPQRSQPDAKLTGMLRSLIQKTNSDEKIDEIAKTIEQYISTNKAARGHVARISKSIADSDRLANYGTEQCQQVLKRWAKKYNSKSENNSKQDRAKKDDRKQDKKNKDK